MWADWRRPWAALTVYLESYIYEMTMIDHRQHVVVGLQSRKIFNAEPRWTDSREFVRFCWWTSDVTTLNSFHWRHNEEIVSDVDTEDNTDDYNVVIVIMRMVIRREAGKDNEKDDDTVKSAYIHLKKQKQNKKIGDFVLFCFVF